MLTQLYTNVATAIVLCNSFWASFRVLLFNILVIVPRVRSNSLKFASKSSFSETEIVPLTN
jgi:hypothetical protein